MTRRPAYERFSAWPCEPTVLSLLHLGRDRVDPRAHLLSVHLDGEPERLPVYRKAVGSGALPAGFAVDDCAALLIRGTTLDECVSSRPGARVVRVSADGEGGTAERSMPVRVLPGAVAAAAPVGAGEPRGVSELRALRAGRHRWD